MILKKDLRKCKSGGNSAFDFLLSHTPIFFLKYKTKYLRYGASIALQIKDWIIMTRLCGVLIAIAILVLVLVLPVAAATYNATKISQGAVVFIGESGLDLSAAIGGGATMIAWFPPGAQSSATIPEFVLDVSSVKTYFSVDPSVFVVRTGNWYCWSWGQTLGDSVMAFIVADPAIDVKVWDLDQNKDVSGTSVPKGERLTFQVETNGYTVAIPAMRPNILQPTWDGSSGTGSYYGFDPATGFSTPKTAEGFIDILVKTDQGNSMNALYYATGGTAVPLNGMWVNTNPWRWGNSTYGVYWNTSALDGIGQKVYPPGTYTVTAEFNLNGMKGNYKNNGAYYTGKTVSEARTITLVTDTVRIEANKDTVVRSKPFSVTVTGRPSAWYWVWVKGTGAMSGAADDQPPYIPASYF
jgi:hypothetical protein